MTDTSVADHRFDLTSMTPQTLRDCIHGVPVIENEETPPPMIELTGLSGQDGVCSKWNHPVRIRARGDAGNYAFAWCKGIDVHLTGNVGHAVAEGFAAGVIRVTGNAGCAAGLAMNSGVLAIYGDAGPRCGAAMRGGSLFVRGDVGDDTGCYALGGTIVVGGDAGCNLGDSHNNLTLFLRGKAQSLAAGLVEAPLRKREQVKLGLLLMNASIRGSATDFRRIIPLAKLHAEQANQGELHPNWR
jgi:methylamine---glutamate N-methyltransferase subunit B